MPTAMTFNSLLGDLRGFIERGQVQDTSVYAQLPRIVNRVERDLATKLKVLGLKNVVTGTFSAGVSVYAKPDRWRETTSINFGVGSPPQQRRVPLYPRSYEYCRMYWPNPEETGQPEFYADYDYNHWLIVPTPSENYPFEINYWGLPPLLDESNQTNWLTEYAPNALLFGSLLQCAPFLKEDERIPIWQGFYNEQLAALDGQDLQRVIDQQAARREV